MKGYLLDTSVALLAVADPNRLSVRIQTAIKEGPALLSAVVYWEVILKAMKGTLDVGDPRTWWTDTLDALQLLPLFLRPEHVGAIWDLPPIHRDPFDRALIAQAIVEDLTMLTTDGVIPKYANKHRPGHTNFRVIT